MDKRPFLSIATPCWNSVATIERTIKSVLDQDFKDYEYIIVDGGSTDGTLEIIKKYEPLFEGRMKWRSEPDKGLYDAFNKGVERSIGIYCWNVNSDDYLEPNALTVLYSKLKNQMGGLPVVSGAMNFRDSEGKILKVYVSNKEKENLCYRSNGMGVNHPATLVPKSIYEEFGAFDVRFKISGDIDWFNRIHAAGVYILHIPDVITNMSDGGISNQFRFKKAFQDRKLGFTKKYESKIKVYYYLMKWTIRFFLVKYKIINQ